MPERRKARRVDMGLPANTPMAADRPHVSSVGEVIKQLSGDIATSSNDPVKLRELQQTRDQLIIDGLISAGLSGISYPGLKIGFRFETPDDRELQVVVTHTNGVKDTFRTPRENPGLNKERARLLARASFRAGFRHEDRVFPGLQRGRPLRKP